MPKDISIDTDAQESLKSKFTKESQNPEIIPPDILQHLKEVLPKLIFDHEDVLLGGARNPLIYHRDDTYEDDAIEGAPKVKKTNPYFIYVSDKEDLEDIKEHYTSVKQGILDQVANGTLPADKLKKFNENGILDIEVRRIPRDENGTLAIGYDEHGLLHIPERGISPGLERFPKGILFNWDTSFIIRGVVQLGHIDLAKELTDMMLYEIEHYNGIPNANATFCLTDNPNEPRCQPPFIAAKVLLIYNIWDELESPPEESKNDWLKRALPLVEHHINFWTDPEGCHVDKNTGLSKYGSTFGKPAVEALHAEPEHFRTAYNDLLYLYEKHISNPLPIAERDYQGRKDGYYVEMFLDLDETGKPVPLSIYKNKKHIGGREIEVYEVDGLTAEYFDGDIAMRESGLDATRRFGFMAADANNLAPSDLNCFIRKMMDDTAQAYRELGHDEPENPDWSARASVWQDKADKLKSLIQTTMWDDGKPQFEGDNPDDPNRPMPPCFRDLYLSPTAEKYNLGTFRRFNFAMQAAAGLWTGVATEEQAHTIITEVYPLFLDPCGFSLSDFEGYMWDKRKTFSPAEIMAAEGAELNGYYHVSKHLRVTRKDTIYNEFKRTGEVWEKMETITGTNNTAQYQLAGVGYDHNDPGFGWTNTEFIDACMAIPRLDLKIKGEYIPPPCISTNFVVLDKGYAAPAKDSPEMLAMILGKAQKRLNREMPHLKVSIPVECEYEDLAL